MSDARRPLRYMGAAPDDAEPTPEQIAVRCAAQPRGLGRLDMSHERWRRAMVAGGRPISAEQWQRIVDKAISLAATNGSRLEPVAAGDMILRATEVLGIEMMLIEAQRLTDEVRRLAESDTDEARRERLRRAIDDATEIVRRSLAMRSDT